MSGGRKNELDMVRGPLAGKIVLFALPLAASSVLQQLFNAADIAVVGRFANARAMAAVGSNASVVTLLLGMFIGLSVGANVVTANLLGADRRDRISDAVHTAILLALCGGLFLTGFGILMAPAILRLMGAPEDVMALAVLYLRIFFLGMPAINIYNFGAAILRSKGDSRRPFISLTLAGVANVLLNLLFVIVFHLHVIGVALATVISNVANACMILRFLTKEEGEFRLDLRRLRFTKDMLLHIVQIGVPAGLQGMVFSLSNVVIQSAVNSFGSDCIAGMAASQNFDFISFSILNSFGQAAMTFVSQNYGAWEEERCRRVLRLSMAMGIGFDIVMIGFVMLGRHTLISLFTTEPRVMEYAMVRMFRTYVFHFLVGTYEIPGGAMRGMKRSMVPALISVLGTCAFRLLYVLVYFPMHRTIEVLMTVYPASWILTGLAMNIAYFIVRRRAFRKTA